MAFELRDRVVEGVGGQERRFRGSTGSKGNKGSKGVGGARAAIGFFRKCDKHNLFSSSCKGLRLRPDKGNPTGFSWAGMSGPAHERFRLPCGVAGGLGLLFAKRQELLQGAVAGSLGGRGVALQGDQGAGGVVDEGCGDLGVGIGGAGGVDDLLDRGGFETAGAGEPPAGLDHFLDQEALVRGGGREGAVVFGD